MEPKVVVAGRAFPAVPEFLRAEMPEIQVDQVPLDQLFRSGCNAEVLIPMMSRITPDLMDRINGLQLIQQWGAGLESVDIEAATSRKIAVANVPSAGSGNAESVAEWCVMAAIALSRRLAEAHDCMRTGHSWGWPCGRGLAGRTAGIIGLGGVGQALAARLKPFGMRLIALKRRPDAALRGRLGIDWIGTPDRLPDLLRLSDYVFLCVALTDQTRSMIDEAAFAMLPPGACIINASRGAVIDQEALCHHLTSARLLGAALDVYDFEPFDHQSPLLNRKNLLATPHIAGVTDISYSGISHYVAANIRRFIKGELIANCVNQNRISTSLSHAQREG